MPRRKRKSEGLPGDRPAHPERKLLSIQDWYGFGVIDGIIGKGWTHGWQYCGKAACNDQYTMGRQHGRGIRLAVSRQEFGELSASSEVRMDEQESG